MVDSFPTNLSIPLIESSSIVLLSLRLPVILLLWPLYPVAFLLVQLGPILSIMYDLLLTLRVEEKIVIFCWPSFGSTFEII